MSPSGYGTPLFVEGVGWGGVGGGGGTASPGLRGPSGLTTIGNEGLIGLPGRGPAGILHYVVKLVGRFWG